MHNSKARFKVRTHVRNVRGCLTFPGRPLQGRHGEKDSEVHDCNQGIEDVPKALFDTMKLLDREGDLRVHCFLSRL